MNTMQLTKEQTETLIRGIKDMDFQEEIDSVGMNVTSCVTTVDFEMDGIIENDVIYGDCMVKLVWGSDWGSGCDVYVLRVSAYAYDENDEEVECILAA